VALSAEAIAEKIRDDGLLLQSDPSAPSVVGLLVGEPVSGSWWGRPDGKAIYRGLEALEDDPDLALFKLLNGKVTFVHRRLWPALAAVGAAKAAWQTDGLPEQALAALEVVEAQGEVSARLLPGADSGSAGRIAGKLETRLLVCSRQVHTAEGAHAKALTSWTRWLALKGERAEASVDPARRRVEQAAAAAYGPAGKAIALPWQA
jgi:hypothetical protein